MIAGRGRYAKGLHKESLHDVQRAGWVKTPSDWHQATAERDRVLNRLLKGLRVRTLKQRVQAAEKFFRWISLNGQTMWPPTAGLPEDYLQDLAGHPHVGSSSFSRARMGLLYLVSVAGVEASLQVARSPAVLVVIKELKLQAGLKQRLEKKEAPHYL